MLFGKEAWYEIELMYLEDLLTLFEETQKTWKIKMDKIDTELKKLNDVESEKYVDFYYDDIVQVRDTLPRITNNAVLTNAFSFYELNLLKFYDEVKEKINSENNARFLKDKIEFLNKELNEIIHFNDIEHLELVREIRNRIMHSVGKIDKVEYENLVQVIKDTSDISINHHDEIVIEDEFIRKTFQIIENVLRSLNHKISELDSIN